MRSDRERSDELTTRLLQLERALEEAFRNGPSAAAVGESRAAIAGCTWHLPFTSKEIDYCMQVAMLDAGLSIYALARERSGVRNLLPDAFRVSVAVHYEKYQTIVLKTSAYWPTRCAVTHPHFQAQIGGSGLGDRSVLRLAMIRNRVICCESHDRFKNCGFQFDIIGFASASALCIPIQGSDPYAPAPFVAPEVMCSFQAQQIQGGPAERPAIAGICIESPSFFIDQNLAREWLALDSTLALLQKISAATSHFLKARSKYRLLLYCSCLVQLSQGLLRGRESHRAILRTISRLSGGPDVTLHLCDMLSQPQDDRKLSSRIISAFGPRVRGFLLTERYRGGLVGRAIEEQKDHYWNAGKIVSSIRAQLRQVVERSAVAQRQEYRQIMPGTVAELVIPIVFFGRAIGAINLEWSADSAAGLDPGRLNALRPLLRRIGQYYSLVVDYHDDHKNPDLHGEARAGFWHEIVPLELNRQALRYYVGLAAKAIRYPSEGAEEFGFLKPIAQVVGYLAPFRNQQRVKVSIRRKIEDKNLLAVIAEHGLTEPEERQDLPIDPERLVLGRVATVAFPLFGEVNAEARTLICDPLCMNLMPAEVKNAIKDAPHVPYFSPCEYPVYEVALPLVFGGLVLGTLNIEFCDSDRRPAFAGQGDQPALTPQMLFSLLDWARAISFLMAFAEDWRGRALRWKLSSGQEQIFEEFLELCLSVIAFVPLSEVHVRSIMNSYLNSIARIGRVSFSRRKELDPADGGVYYAKDQRVWIDSSFAGIAEVVREEDNLRTGGAIFGDGRAKDCAIDSLLLDLARVLKGAHWSAVDRSDPDRGEFRNRIALIEAAFSGAGEVDSSELSVKRLLQATLEQLHGLFEKYFAPGGFEAESAYGWFIYGADYDSARKADDPKRTGSVFRSGTPGKRWSFMGTRELHDLWRNAGTDPCGTFQCILEAADRRAQGNTLLQEMIQAVRRQLENAECPSFAEMAALITETLACRTFDIGYSATKSLTLRIAERRMSELVHDLGRNPNRSSEYSDWFFGEHPYSLIGIPVVLGGKTVAEIQLLRRRLSQERLDFFKQEEFDALDGLKRKVEAYLDEQIECVALGTVDVVVGATRFREKDLDRLEARLNNRKIRRIFIADATADLSIASLEQELKLRFPARSFRTAVRSDHKKVKVGGTWIFDCRKMNPKELPGLRDTLLIADDPEMRDHWIVVFDREPAMSSLVDDLLDNDNSVEVPLLEDIESGERAKKELLLSLDTANTLYQEGHSQVLARRDGPRSLSSFALALKERGSLKVGAKRWLDEGPEPCLFAGWIEAPGPKGSDKA